MYVCNYEDSKLFVDAANPEAYDRLKNLSNEHKLFCLGCGRQVIFRRCTAKDSHFAHLSSQGKQCDFEQYIMNLPESHKSALEKLKNKFAESNNPQLFEKLIEKHWTSMTLCVDGKIVSIELLQPKASYITTQNLKKVYAEKGIGVLWLFIVDDTFCEYESVSNTGASGFFQSNNYIIAFNPENDQIAIEYKEGKTDLYHSDIFKTSISLDQLTIDTEGKVSKCIKVQYDNWKKQWKLQAQRYKEQSAKVQSIYWSSEKSNLSNLPLTLTRDELQNNVTQWIESVQNGAGWVTLNAIRTLITKYPEYLQVYKENIQGIKDPELKAKFEILLP